MPLTASERKKESTSHLTCKLEIHWNSMDALISQTMQILAASCTQIIIPPSHPKYKPVSRVVSFLNVL